MYKDFWKLKELPFENTPDPRFFYTSVKHHEALSRLQYLVREKKACGVLTGVYGCGKTLVLQALRKSTEPEGVKFSFVTNPRLDDLGILRLVLRGLTMHEVPAHKADVLMGLQSYIESVAQDGKHSVIVIDEAHAINNDEVFEELRLLMNFQQENRFLLTLLLVGQPELKNRVDANKQLNQRVSLRFHLDAFGLPDTQNYIRHRLSVAGDAQHTVFTPEAIELIQRHSGGIPRWINNYCHMSLLTAFGKGLHHITPEIVDEAVASLSGAS